MWTWLIGGYPVLVAVLVTYTAHIAVSDQDQGRRGDAYKVLKLIWGTAATGTGGIIAIAVKLHELGVL